MGYQKGTVGVASCTTDGTWRGLAGRMCAGIDDAARVAQRCSWRFVKYSRTCVDWMDQIVKETYLFGCVVLEDSERIRGTDMLAYIRGARKIKRSRINVFVNGMTVGISSSKIHCYE